MEIDLLLMEFEGWVITRIGSYSIEEVNAYIKKFQYHWSHGRIFHENLKHSLGH